MGYDLTCIFLNLKEAMRNILEHFFYKDGTLSCLDRFSKVLSSLRCRSPRICLCLSWSVG